MAEGIINKIADWSEGKLADEALLEAVGASRPDLESHRDGFTRIVEELNPNQRERCEELIAFIMSVIDMMSTALDHIVESVEKVAIS